MHLELPTADDLSAVLVAMGIPLIDATGDYNCDKFIGQQIHGVDIILMVHNVVIQALQLACTHLSDQRLIILPGQQE